MRKVGLNLLLGVIAGIIDVTPMLLQNLPWHYNLSAFVFWLVMGVLIPSVQWSMAAWLKGLLVAELAALPMMILVIKDDPASVIAMVGFSAMLGALVGFAGHKLMSHP